MNSMAKPQVVHLNLSGSNRQESVPDFFNAIRSKADLKRITKIPEATALFTSTPRPPIFTDDGALCRPENHELRAQAIEYICSGGTIIGISSFGSSMSHGHSILRGAWTPVEGC